MTLTSPVDGPLEDIEFIHCRASVAEGEAEGEPLSVEEMWGF